MKVWQWSVAAIMVMERSRAATMEINRDLKARSEASLPAMKHNGGKSNKPKTFREAVLSVSTLLYNDVKRGGQVHTQNPSNLMRTG